MNIQNLIVYQFNVLYEILKELDQDLNFEIIETKNIESLYRIKLIVLKNI